MIVRRGWLKGCWRLRLFFNSFICSLTALLRCCACKNAVSGSLPQVLQLPVHAFETSRFINLVSLQGVRQLFGVGICFSVVEQIVMREINPRWQL
jgi:hypothetical protein